MKRLFLIFLQNCSGYSECVNYSTNEYDSEHYISTKYFNNKTVVKIKRSILFANCIKILVIVVII